MEREKPQQMKMEEGGDGRMEGATGAALTPPCKQPGPLGWLMNYSCRSKTLNSPREKQPEGRKSRQRWAAAHRQGDCAGV